MRFREFKTLLLLLLLTQPPLVAREYLFRRFDSSYSLHDNTVRNVLELPDGIMCIQTLNMLNIFDGAAVVGYKYDMDKILYDEYNAMKSIYCDSEERVWIRNRDDIWAFDLKERRFLYNIDSIARGFTSGSCRVENLFVIDGDKYITYDKQARAIHYYDQTTQDRVRSAMPALVQDPLEVVQVEGDLWMLCTNGSLAQYSIKDHCFIYVEQGVFSASLDDSRFHKIAHSSGLLWMLLGEKIICYDTHDYRFISEFMPPLEDGDFFTTITVNDDGKVWVGTAHSGIYIIDAESMKVERLSHLKVVGGREITINTGISQLYVDSSGGVWVATDSEGLLYHHKDIIDIRNIDNLTLSKGEMQDLNIKCMLHEDDGSILLGTGDGIYRYDPKSNSVSTPYPQLRNIPCIGLYRDSKDRIWLGTFRNGAFCIDGDKVRHYFYPDVPSVEDSYIKSTPNLNSVRTFYETADGDILVSVYRGLGLLNEQSGKIELINSGANSKYSIIRGVHPISSDELLVYSDNGLFVYNKHNERVDSDILKSLHIDSSYDIYTDKRGLMWIASLDGLVVYDSVTKRQRMLNQYDGLLGNKVFSIVADRDDNIWVATSAGISAVMLQEQWSIDDIMIVNFTQKDGMNDAPFFYRSALLGDDGMLYFGSSSGVCVVDPACVVQPSSLSNRLLIKTTIKDRKGHDIQNASAPIIKAGESSKLTLDSKVSSISFDFVGLNYINPNHTRYRYKLDNYDYDWVETDGDRGAAKASYSYLHSGKYTLLVQSANNGSWWGDEYAHIEITVLPSWWRSTSALVIYSILILGALYFISNMYVRRKYAASLRLQEEEKQRHKDEVEAMKQQFFINVSHELRTPLSLILLPLESILGRIDADNSLKPQLLTMQRNAKSLRTLVDDLLNFRKLDMNAETLKPIMGDMHRFVSALCTSYRDAAQVEEIDFSFESEVSKLYMAFDRSMMQKVLNNLLSNAMKFTPKGGFVKITLRVVELADSSQMVQISIKDSGKGIPQKDLNFIFDRFYQASNNVNSVGSGIGLSMTKSYVELHGGRIEVESLMDRGTTFVVSIPTNIEAESCHDESEVVADLSVSQDVDCAPIEEPKEQRFKVLIVEDNVDFREYLTSELSEYFDVISAENGEQGLALAREVMPDLITSDVMMPLLDGYELTKRLKADIETSHIPIILLTVQSSDENRLSAYESGADAYITKPFKWEVLHARINNLIDERRSRIEKIADNRDLFLEELKLAPLDDKFIRKAVESIDRNLDNTEYSVEIMSEDLSMNRMSIYRKFKSILEQTPADFIRNVRIKRAAQWIEAGDRSGYSLVEIANKFGFNTPKYFTKYFKDIYSQTPMQYITKFRKR